jgi:hypothetical protein
LFPELKKKPKKGMKLNFGIDWAVMLTVASVLGNIGVSGGTAMAIGSFVGTLAVYVLTAAVSLGLSMGISAAMAKKPSSGSISNNGRVFNTRVVSEPIRIIYGEARVGGNSIFSL